MQDNKYDLGRLVNVRDRALKSLLAGKFLKARDKKIVFNVEVPEEIQVEGMSLLDFLTIVSILCDNAIEASAEASQPHVSIAFLKMEHRRHLSLKIPSKKRASIFRRFFLLEQVLKGRREELVSIPS